MQSILILLLGLLLGILVGAVLARKSSKLEEKELLTELMKRNTESGRAITASIFCQNQEPQKGIFITTGPEDTKELFDWYNARQLRGDVIEVVREKHGGNVRL